MKFSFSRCKFVGAVVVALVVMVTPVWADEGKRLVVGKERVHIVKSGESLYTIAQDYGLAIEHVAWANGLSPDSINVAPGKELVIPCRRVLPLNPPANGLVVNLPERGVFLFCGGKFEKFYPVCIGQPGKFATPQGNFSIANKAVDPVWSPPEWAGIGEEPVPAGPSNPLGDRWIGLTAPGIGLHSTTSPMSIGQSASHGCMRMYPNSVRELFEKVSVNWPVRIEYETAKVGYDDESGAYCLVSFPDVYGQRSPLKAAEEAISDLGFDVDSEDLRDSVRKDGLVLDLTVAPASVPVNVVVNDQPYDGVRESMLIDGVLMAPAKLAARLGLGVTWDSVKQVVRVSRGMSILAFPLNDDYSLGDEEVAVGKTIEWGGQAQMIQGTAMIPLRPVLNKFAVPNVWESASKTIKLYSLK